MFPVIFTLEDFKHLLIFGLFCFVVRLEKKICGTIYCQILIELYRTVFTVNKDIMLTRCVEIAK